MKKHSGFIIFFASIIFIFLGKLIFMKAAFLQGDYLVQFYPWSQVYSEAIKNFCFPFWTGYVNSGFPLIAEGQIGGFYPLNAILFFMLPLNVAYNYSVILHFILAGIFTYVYAYKMGAGKYGGSLSALLFCFGSSYAGCFYNIITLRTLVWLPLVLFLIEKYFENKKIRYIFFIGIISGMQLLAGFVQMAVYTFFFYLLYFLYGLKLRKEIDIKNIIKITAAFSIAIILAYPQLALTLKMVNLSTRMQNSLGFALWGSFSPLNFISLCFPSLVFYGMQFYVGIFSLIFLISAIYALKTTPKIRPLAAIFFIALFLALGAYNPLYVFLIKVTHLYSFRNPSKFIFFAVFAASILTGLGFASFFGANIKAKARILNMSSIAIGSMVAIFVFAKIILYILKDKIINIGNWYITHYIIGKDYHRYSLELYLSKVKGFYKNLVEAVSFSNVFLLSSLFFCFLAIFVCKYLLRKQNINAKQRKFFIAVIFIDIFIFSFYGTGFRGNIKSFDSLKPTHKKILQALQSDKSLFRILPYCFASYDMPWWTRPSANIIVGIDSIASYSPLAQRSYKYTLDSLEVVDNSLGVLYPSDEAIAAKRDLLKLLNVKYIVTPHKLNFDFLEEVMVEEGICLYKLKEYLPRVFFTTSLDKQAMTNNGVSIKIVKYYSGYMQSEFNAKEKGFIVFSENYYPYWNAFIDGEKKPIMEVENVIQAVAIGKGEHKIIFQYNPFDK
ncbi:MAG: hypothetical protein WC546_02405 [Candidatus Omnitrophota bacterium]